MQAVHLAAQAVKCGDADLLVAGGQENMSSSMHLLPKSRDGQRMGDWKLQDSMIVDGLWCAFNNYHSKSITSRVSLTSGNVQWVSLLRTLHQSTVSTENHRMHSLPSHSSGPRRQSRLAALSTRSFRSRSLSAGETQLCLMPMSTPSPVSMQPSWQS